MKILDNDELEYMIEQHTVGVLVYQTIMEELPLLASPMHLAHLKALQAFWESLGTTLAEVHPDLALTASNTLKELNKLAEEI